VETLLFRGRNKVATTLSTTNWRKVTPSMRAIFIWPLAFLRTKSLPVAGGEHVKLALGLAAGTVAPLVAFGVVQGLLWGGGATPSHVVRSGPSGGIAGAQASGGRPDIPAPAHRSVVRMDAAKKDQPGRQRHDKGTNQPETTKGAGHSGGSGHSGGAGGEPQPTQPPEPTQPPQVAAPAPKVIACVGTASGKNPGVTVTLSQQGLNGHPTAGPCT
jgi:hypothetical protein